MTRAIETYADFERVVQAILSQGPPAPIPEPAGTAEPEVTVAMPARNAAPFIGVAMASVLRQTDIRLELIVVDDASHDDTLAVASNVDDPRVRVLRNHERRGIGACHNRVVEASRAPIISHVDADDFIVPWALRTMVDGLTAAPRAAQAYCNHFRVGVDGTLDAAAFGRQREALQRYRRHLADYRRALIVHGMVTNTLRTYRKVALLDAGPFDESLPWAVDYEMAVRLADAHDMQLVPEFLYMQRAHAGSVQQNLRWRALRAWRMRVEICERLLAANGGRLLGRSRSSVRALLGVGLAHVAWSLVRRGRPHG